MKLGELIEIKHGYAFSGEHIVEDDNGIVLVTPGNFRIGGGFKEEKCKFFDGEIPADYVLKEGDFIVTMTDLSKTIDTLGYSALVPKSKRTYLHNQRIGLVTFKSDECDRGYIYWLMRTREYQRSIANTSTGATVHHTSPKKIYDYDLEVPPLPIQHRIATILSRYDSLIENYQKQIKLLEEAAQRLYKEWFIDLRFPGHENTKIVDGLPEGWEKKKLHEIAEVVMGSSPKSEFYNNDKQGLPFHQGVGSYGTRFVDDNVYSTSITRLAEPNSILFSVRAPVGRLNITKNKIIIGRGLAAMNHKDGFQSFLFYMLKERFFMDNIIGNGSIFASISKVELLDQEFIVPPMKTIMAFESLASKLDKKIQGVDTQLRLLTEARDRLLPKLMSGELTLEARAEKEDLLATPCKGGDEAK